MTAVVEQDPVQPSPPPRRLSGQRLTAVLAGLGVVGVLVGLLSSSPESPTTPVTATTAETPVDRSITPLPRFLQPTGLYRTEPGPQGLFPGNWLDDAGELAPVEGRLGRYVAMYAVTVREPRDLTIGDQTQTVGLTPRTFLFGPLRSPGNAVELKGEEPLVPISATDRRKVSVFLGPALSSNVPRFLLPEQGYYPRETGLIGTQTTTFQWMTSRTRMGIHIDGAQPGQAWTLRVALRSPIRRKAVIRFTGGATGPATSTTLEPGRDVSIEVRGVRLAGERGTVVINFAGPTSVPADPRPLFAQLRSATITP